MKTFMPGLIRNTTKSNFLFRCMSGWGGRERGGLDFQPPELHGRWGCPGTTRCLCTPKSVSKLRSMEIKEKSNKTSIRLHKIKYGQGKQVSLCLGGWGRSISRLASPESCPFSSSTLQISLRLVDRLSPTPHWQTTYLTPKRRDKKNLNSFFRGQKKSGWEAENWVQCVKNILELNTAAI